MAREEHALTPREIARHYMEARAQQLKRHIDPKTGKYYPNMTFTLYGWSTDEYGVARDHGTGLPLDTLNSFYL